MDLVRGDTLKVKFPIVYHDGENVDKKDIATLFMTFKKSAYSHEILIQKELEQVSVDDNGYYTVEIKPEDTETLNYGEYIFDIEVTLTNGYRKTKVGTLTLKEETTFHGGDVNA